MQNVALIMAAGMGTRLKSDIPKQYLRIADKLILQHSIEAFLDHPDIDQVLVVINKLHINLFNDIQVNVNYCIGGNNRCESVRLGLKAIKHMNPKNVLIHDGARPFVSASLIYKVIKGLINYDAIDVALDITDTIKSKQPHKYLERSNYYLTQTPQGFNFKSIYDLHHKYKSTEFTDDISLCLKDDINVKFIEGCKFNFKITTREDLIYAKFIYTQYQDRLWL